MQFVANQDAEEKTKNWYEVVGKTLEVLKNPNEVFDSTTYSGEKRSILQSIVYNPVLLDRIIVVEPYKWLQKLTENAKKIETDLNRVITEPHKIEKSLKRGNFTDWSGRQDSNLRPQLPKSCALPTVLRPEDLKISYHELFFLSIPTKPSMVLKFI